MSKKPANKKTTSLIDRDSIESQIDFLKHSGIAFTLKISNYTTEIISELYNIRFVHSMRGNGFFSAYSKVKSDVKDKAIPDIDRLKINYFNHNFKKDFYADSVINIDLRSAYATALFNAQMITEATYNYLEKIPKLDRLAGVGMLASKKYVFDYDTKGVIAHFTKQVSPFENFFYYCAAEVEKVMGELQMLCEDQYLFTWVDGIYFKNDPETLERCLIFLKDIEYRYSVEMLENFTVSITATKAKLQFLKEGSIKYFQIPAEKNPFADGIINQMIREGEQRLKTKNIA